MNSLRVARIIFTSLPHVGSVVGLRLLAGVACLIVSTDRGYHLIYGIAFDPSA